MKILLVDDDAFLRDMYVTKFSESGATAAVAASGEEAIAAIEKESFDVILMDMVMPGMSGLDLLAAIHERNSETAPKCIVLSNQGEAKDVEAATAAGAVGYIVKAESIPSEVVEKVTKLMA